MEGGEAIFVVRLHVNDGSSSGGRRGNVAEEPPSLGDYAGDLRRSDELRCGGDDAVLMTTARWCVNC